MGKKGITLYHGTDAHMVEMTMEERQEYFACCNLVINNLYPYYIPQIFPMQYNQESIIEMLRTRLTDSEMENFWN